MTPVRVAHVITDLEIGGAELMLARLVGGVDRSRIDNVVISLGTTGPIGLRIQQSGIPVHALDMKRGRPNPAALWRLAMLLRRLKPEVIQTWLYHADLVGLIGRVASPGARVVWNIRCAELDPRDHPRLQPLLLRLLAMTSKVPSAVVCNSVAGRRAHERLGYTPRRWCIIPNGFDTAAFRPEPEARRRLRHELGLPDNARLVGLLARFHPMKDHPTFLRAASAVARRQPDVHFVAAGAGIAENEGLARLARELRIEPVMHLLPGRSDASDFLAGLDVAVSSSYSEAFPNVVGEAMACGTPCVVTDVGDSATIVGESGIVVPPRSPGALADAILRLLDLDRASLESLGRAARERIVSEFSIERAAARYEALYTELVNGTMTTKAESICAG
jgi:glycosyltransferase involved in cell wall biosynthesis